MLTNVAASRAVGVSHERESSGASCSGVVRRLRRDWRREHWCSDPAVLMAVAPFDSMLVLFDSYCMRRTDVSTPHSAIELNSEQTAPMHSKCPSHDRPCHRRRTPRHA